MPLIRDGMRPVPSDSANHRTEAGGSVPSNKGTGAAEDLLAGPFARTGYPDEG